MPRQVPSPDLRQDAVGGIDGGVPGYQDTLAGRAVQGDGDGGGKGGRRRWEQMAPEDRWGPGVDNNAGGIWLRNPCGDGQGCEYRACRDLNLGFSPSWGPGSPHTSRSGGTGHNRRSRLESRVAFGGGCAIRSRWPAREGERRLSVVQPGRLATAGNVKSGRPIGVVPAVAAAAFLGLGKLPSRQETDFSFLGHGFPARA